MAIPTFGDWLAAKLGTHNWVLARRSRRILEHYGSDVLCLTRTRFAHLKDQYERETGRSVNDPSYPSRFLVDAAPALLTALKAGVHYWENSYSGPKIVPDWITAARGAIAQAEGR